MGLTVQVDVVDAGNCRKYAEIAGNTRKLRGIGQRGLTEGCVTRGVRGEIFKKANVYKGSSP